MIVTVYTPQRLEIEDSAIPHLSEKARKRNRVPADKNVPVRYIIEEARRAGLLKLGKDYCLDLEDEALNGRRPRRSRKRPRGYNRSERPRAR